MVHSQKRKKKYSMETRVTDSTAVTTTVFEKTGNFVRLPRLFLVLEESTYDAHNREVCEEEIKDELFGIGACKSLGPDGFPAAFF
ncbi:hypothetical protein QYF36_020031 [Acer negundo]|nr:hypothetical protein QYF36_020031 [Acer negundo]